MFFSRDFILIFCTEYIYIYKLGFLLDAYVLPIYIFAVNNFSSRRICILGVNYFFVVAHYIIIAINNIIHEMSKYV